MDFFQAQDQARRRTALLVLLFALAVLCLIGLTFLLVAVLFYGFAGQATVLTGPEAHQLGWLQRSLGLSGEAAFWIAALIIGTVGLASGFRWLGLRGGGSSVAAAVGARRVDADSRDPHERRLLNIVEEMAIAAGMPVPPVFVMDREDGINAFAAGYGTGDAVVAVTRGCLTRLSRDQLQGVVAHEFSHILNGDMRLNIRLLAVLAGIVFIGESGRFLLHSLSRPRYRSSNSKDNGGIVALLALALGLMLIGYVGIFFGKLIKAAVSRQREYLADASAVQFTRNPQGIADALKVIGGHVDGSQVQSPGAGEISHFFFNEALRSGFTGWLATHPPLERRIRALDPGWNGRYLMPADPQSTAAEAEPETAHRPTPLAAAALLGALAHTGQPTPEHVDQARQLIAEIPDTLRDAAHNPWSARAVIHALLIDNDADVRQQQWQTLQSDDPALADLSLRLAETIRALDVRCRLPLIEMSLPALKQMSAAQYAIFRQQLIALARADRHISTFEWVLARLMLHDLGPAFGKASTPRSRYRRLDAVETELQTLLSFLASHHATDEEAASLAFQAGSRSLNQSSPFLPTVTLKQLDQALGHLALCYPLLKPGILKACAATLMADGVVSAEEAELLRAIAAILDCPIPPLIHHA